MDNQQAGFAFLGSARPPGSPFFASAGRLNRHGYVLEGAVGVVYNGLAPGTVPLFRLWHEPSRHHSLTAHPENRAAALATGAYRDEGIVGYVFGTNEHPGTVPLYALVSRVSNAHLYTTDTAKRDAAITAGYETLGIACWVYPAQADQNGA